MVFRTNSLDKVYIYWPVGTVGSVYDAMPYWHRRLSPLLLVSPLPRLPLSAATPPPPIPLEDILIRINHCLDSSLYFIWDNWEWLCTWVSPMLVTGANVSTMIFCEVSLRLSQSMDLNIRRARLISLRKISIFHTFALFFTTYVCMESLTLKVNVILLECTHCQHAMQIHLFLMSCFNFEAYLWLGPRNHEGDFKILAWSLRLLAHDEELRPTLSLKKKLHKK